MSYPLQLDEGWARLALEVDAEIARARKKFPSSILATTALTEEHGEAVRAVLEHYYAVRSAKNHGEIGESEVQKYRAAVRKELIQTMAMCVRLEMEGDKAHLLTPGKK